MLGLACGVANAVPEMDVECKNTQLDNASYVGIYKGEENNLNAEDLYKDIYCAEAFKKKYQNGFVTIFGSSRIEEKNYINDPEVNAENDKIYKQVYDFAYIWTQKYGEKYPIMTGAGPGLMEAGSRGAIDANKLKSIGYTTYYGASRENGGKASEAFAKYGKKDIISDGLIFSSVVVREYMMILHSSAMIFTPGGTGTEWEIFQTIEKIKSGQLKRIPIYIVGNKQKNWKSFYDRLDDMDRRGTIRRSEAESLFLHVDNLADVIQLLEKKLSGLK